MNASETLGLPRRSALALAVLLACAGTGSAAEAGGPASAKPASPATRASNAAVLQALPFSDRQDYEDASRGLVAAFSGQIKDAEGKVVWDTHQYDFLTAEQAPDSVNPSLWRMAQLNSNAGLFQVAERLYQVRGVDLANMTIIEGDQGW